MYVTVPARGTGGIGNWFLFPDEFYFNCTPLRVVLVQEMNVYCTYREPFDQTNPES